MAKWKTWKSLVVLQAQCRERRLDTRHCTFKRDYCKVLNLWEEAQEAIAAGAAVPPAHAPHQSHAPKHMASRTTTNAKRVQSPSADTSPPPPPPPPRKRRTRATRQHLRTARADLEALNDKLPLTFSQARDLNISHLKISAEGTATPRISELRAGILAFDVEGVHAEDIEHYTACTNAQIRVRETELQHFTACIARRQRRHDRDVELMQHDPDGALRGTLELVEKLVSERNEVLKRAFASRGANVEGYTDWPPGFGTETDQWSARDAIAQRIRELVAEVLWLEEDIGNWEIAVKKWEDLMGWKLSWSF